MKEKLIEEIDTILCDYYEAATNGKRCCEEVQAFMGNKDWADTILFRVFEVLKSNGHVVDLTDKEELANPKCSCVDNGPYACVVHRPMDLRGQF